MYYPIFLYFKHQGIGISLRILHSSVNIHNCPSVVVQTVLCTSVHDQEVPLLGGIITKTLAFKGSITATNGVAFTLIIYYISAYSNLQKSSTGRSAECPLR